MTNLIGTAAGLDRADVSAPAFYRDALLPLGEARVLPPAAFRSLPFSRIEDIAIWASDWVCAGSTADIPEVGDLLPVTIGTHGLHVQRTPAGLVARFNKAQHGGCRSVPVQCQGGTKTKCSFTSCGYSRDRGPIPGGQLGDGTPEMHQYLGLRPERLLTAKVETWGPLVFLNLDVAPSDFATAVPSVGACHAFFNGEPTRRVAHARREYAANWKLLAQRFAPVSQGPVAESPSWIAGGCLDEEQTLQTAWLFPNLILLADKIHTCAIVLQPTALGQTMCNISLFGDAGTDAASAETWLDRIDRLAAQAEVDHADAARWGTSSRPETIGAPLPLQPSPQGHWMQRTLADRMLAARTDRSTIFQPSRFR